MVGKSKGLTDTGVRSAKLAAGLHSDGDGLYLSVTASGSKSWRFIWRKGGKRREMGLGVYPAVSLAQARELAFDARKVVAAGGDPIAVRKEQRAQEAAAAALPTFGEAAKKLIDSKEAGWRNEKHRQQWRNTLATYCKPFADKPVSDITEKMVADALEPIWTTKAETASRVRGRIEAVLDFAKVKGWREGENPARWRGHLKVILPNRKKLQRGHHAAMPYAEVPGFMAALRSRPAMAARCLEFAILTAARSGEARGATWDEFDLDAGEWTSRPWQRPRSA